MFSILTIAALVLAACSLQSAFAGQIAQNGVNNRGVAVGINTLMNTVAEVPQQKRPELYLTPDSPNVFGHVKFSF